MLPKRRFWKTEQNGRVFSTYFSGMRVLDLGYDALKMASKMNDRSFVLSSKIFVWGAYNWVRTLRTCKHTHECTRFVNWLNQSGMAISRKCCFTYGFGGLSGVYFRRTLRGFVAQIQYMYSHHRKVHRKTHARHSVPFSNIFVWEA